ncbi:uncharacterized protein LOC128218216 [Mya arenaria]|uniref:uncharacterized protein LOC128218216 n=1 Tax=Mya arenaria TaxID=6604 RepID=UPI0022E571BA|nr:uncharacterized protein LOC128218216 [Mya arenaria]
MTFSATFTCCMIICVLCSEANELCGKTFVDYYGSFSFTKPGKNECNWIISVGSHVSVNVDADMGNFLESCLLNKLSIFTPNASIADSRQTLCKTGNIRFSGLGPVFINLTTDSKRSTTVNVRWETNTTSDNENKIALYVPVTVTVCVIVAVAIFVAICIRQKSTQKKDKGKVDEQNYSNTTTKLRAIDSAHSLQSHPECELREYTALYKPQRSVANANNQDYAVLHQQLGPAYSQDDTEYSEVNIYEMV